MYYVQVQDYDGWQTYSKHRKLENAIRAAKRYKFDVRVITDSGNVVFEA